MAYRYTNTDKWNDSWFCNLKPMEKLLFNYLCDNCDIAGFIEVIVKNWANDIGTDRKQIEGALKGLERGLRYSKSEDCIYIINFLKHQKNLPLNESNKAHQGIIKRFEYYSHKFDIQDINNFIEGASKGLSSPSGNGNGIGNDNGKESLEAKKEILRKRAREFEVQVKSFTEYPKEMLRDFLLYWIEPNKSFTKMRFELQKTWDIKLRLIKWASNQKDFKKSQESSHVMPSKNTSVSNYSAPKRGQEEVNLMKIVLDKSKEMNFNHHPNNN